MNASQATLFNADDKVRFLDSMIEKDSITKETAKNYERILSLATDMEEALNKDINQFTFEELETVMRGFKANNRNTVETYSRVISSYLSWSANEGLCESNLLSDLRPNDFSEYLTNNESYFSLKQIKRWEDRMENYQDAVIVRLLFIGVGGKQMSEIRNLKKSDIDIANKKIKLTNTLKSDENGSPTKYTERYLYVDERTIDLIIGAMSQKTYAKRNGDMDFNPHVRPFTDLVDNGYIVRSSITRTENFNYPVDKFVIYRRIQMLSDMLGIKEFTAKLIQRSGMIAYASEIMQNKEVLLDDLKIVADKFGVKSYHNLKGFLTAENILKTYPNNN